MPIMGQQVINNESQEMTLNAIPSVVIKISGKFGRIRDGFFREEFLKERNCCSGEAIFTTQIRCTPEPNGFA